MSDDVNARMVKAIRAFVKAKGYAPTVRELAAALDVGHSTVQAALLELAKDGKIKKHSGIARGVVLNEEAQ
jgi:DNA-binding transcriptional regulator YhcF (GntR family)